MDRKNLDDRLSKISTVWSWLGQAHSGSPDRATAAQQLLVERYGGAVHRYLLAAVRDPVAADDLAQEFALRLVRGDFKRARADRGRFRDYVKTVLFHLVGDYRRRQRSLPLHFSDSCLEAVSIAAPPEDSDREFREHWREHLLERAWAALAEVQPKFYQVLRFRAEHPKMASPQMVQHLAGRLGQPLQASAVRQMLHRAREKLANMLVDEVAASLSRPTADEIASELQELRLLDYCRPALERRRSQ